MEFEVLSVTELADGCIQYKIEVPDTQRIYLGYFLEGFEGMCSYSTTENKYLQVLVTPSYQKELETLIAELKKWEI